MALTTAQVLNVLNIVTYSDGGTERRGAKSVRVVFKLFKVRDSRVSE